ncbi:uncharacterized protein LOC133529340 [Cydia pomonella]|uniref:uncharacterized protein LOC133529340 n=1 Tax=Cydia pomonella TaxID=82600 RepID=UPI002ADDA071|nr:uncharacterized protein LOC133529340 [Cydia pomonella]
MVFRSPVKKRLRSTAQEQQIDNEEPLHARQEQDDAPPNQTGTARSQDDDINTAATISARQALSTWTRRTWMAISRTRPSHLDVPERQKTQMNPPTLAGQRSRSTSTALAIWSRFASRLQPQLQQQPQSQTLSLPQSQQSLPELQTQIPAQLQTGKPKGKNAKKLKPEDHVELGAYASDVTNNETFLSVVGHLAKLIDRAVNEDKSVNRTNKKAITKASQEILKALDQMKHITKYDIQPAKIREIRQVIEDARSPPPMPPYGESEKKIIDGVQANIDRLVDEQQKINELVVFCLTRPLDNENEEENNDGFTEVLSRKAKKRARAETSVEAGARASGATYADAARRTPYTPKNRSSDRTTQDTSYAVILEPLDPRKESKDALNEVQEKVDLVELGVGIKSVRHTKNNKIVINCETESDRTTLSTAIKHNTTGVTVGVPKLRNPCIKLLGVTSDNANERIVEAIAKQNHRIMDSVDADHKRIKYIRSVKGRNDSMKNVVVEVSPQLYQQMLSQKIKIGYQSVLAVDQSPIIQCFKCMGFGHQAANCTSNSKCGFCADAHDTRNCPRSSKVPCCTNCKGQDKEYNHPAFSQNCPDWIKWDRIARINVRYS